MVKMISSFLTKSQWVGDVRTGLESEMSEVNQRFPGGKHPQLTREQWRGRNLPFMGIQIGVEKLAHLVWLPPSLVKGYASQKES